MLHRAFFPCSFVVAGINNRSGLKDNATRPDHEKESGEFSYKDTPIINIISTL